MRQKGRKMKDERKFIYKGKICTKREKSCIMNNYWQTRYRGRGKKKFFLVQAVVAAACGFQTDIMDPWPRIGHNTDSIRFVIPGHSGLVEG